jgi:hypothetical protein
VRSTSAQFFQSGCARTADGAGDVWDSLALAMGSSNKAGSS